MISSTRNRQPGGNQTEQSASQGLEHSFGGAGPLRLHKVVDYGPAPDPRANIEVCRLCESLRSPSQ